jgi:hypothetical protein
MESTFCMCLLWPMMLLIPYPGLLRAQMRNFPFQLAGLQRLADDDSQFVQIEWLVDIVVGPHPHRLDGGLQNAKGGDHYDDDIVLHLLDFFQDFQAVDAGKLDIEEHHVGSVFAQQAQGVLAGTGAQDFITLLLEILLQRPTDELFVVDHENLVFTHWFPLSGSMAAGLPPAAR